MNSRWTSTGLVILAFCLMTVWFTWPQVVMLNGIPPHEDPLFSIWRLAWVAHQLPAHPTQLLDANVLYPAHGSFVYSDAFLLLGLLSSPLMWAGVPPVVAYNILILASFVASGFATYVFVKHLTGSTLAGLLGGMIYAFAPFRFGHYMHEELLWTCWIPLSLWAMHRTLETARWRYALLTGLFVTAQMYSSIYFGIYLATFISMVGLLLVLVRVVDWRSLAVRRLVMTAVLSGILVAPYLFVYVRSAHVVGTRGEGEAAYFSAEPMNYFSSPDYNWLYGWTFWRFTTHAPDEMQLFPGLCVVALAVIALWPPINRTRVAYAAALLFAIDLSLGFNGITYRVGYYWLPVFRGLRATARFDAFVQITLALLAGYGLLRLIAWTRERTQLRWAATMAAVIASGVAFAEFTNRSIPLIPAATKASPLSTWLQQQPPSVLLELPVPKANQLPGYDPNYQYESVFHWQPMVNGYTSYIPPHYERFLHDMAAFPDERSAAAVRATGVDLVLVHPQWFKNASPNETLAWLRTQPDFHYVGAFADHAGSVQVFRHMKTFQAAEAR
jgi:hypothetical protein